MLGIVRWKVGKQMKRCVWKGKEGVDKTKSLPELKVRATENDPESKW